MLLFLDVIGGGILPPVLQDELEALRADSSGSADVARRIVRLEQLTPLRFAIGAAINTFLLTIVVAVPLGLAFRYGAGRFAAAPAYVRNHQSPHHARINVALPADDDPELMSALGRNRSLSPLPISERN